MTDIFQRAVWALVLLLAFSGCAHRYERVDTTYNRSVDFSALKTYNWWALHGQAETTPDDLVLIRRLIDEDLQGRGLQRAEENPDFLVVVLIIKAQQFEIRENGSPITADRRLVSSPPPYESGPMSLSYEAGTMVVHFVRPQTNHMVWRGTLKTDLDPAAFPHERAAVIERAVKKIMKEFPPS